MVVVEEVPDDPKDVLTRFISAPARTEDDSKELLLALLDEFRYMGDGKWARLTEEFNKRSSENKSKQWVKRAAGKLEAAGDVPLAGKVEVPQEQSRRQQKKAEAKESASEFAAKKVAQDMGSLSGEEERAKFVCTTSVDHFWECLEAGDYPEEECEPIFGCRMGDDIGELVYASWRCLQMRERIKKTDVIEALTNGHLPQKFKQWLDELPTQSPHTMILTKSPEKRSKIPWSVEKLKRCAKPEMRTAVALSVAASAEPDTKTGGYLKEATKVASSVVVEGQMAPENFSWSQQNDEVELVITVEGSVARSDIDIEIKPQEVNMRAPRKLRLLLEAPIVLEGSGWTLAKGQVVVTLEKKAAGSKWTKLLVGK